MNQECSPTDSEVLQRLAELSPFEYDKTRQSAAKELGVSLSALDSEVKSRRKESEDTGTKGRAITFYEPDPWPESVNGAQVLDEAANHIFRHMRIKEGDGHACAVWAAHTYMFESFDHTPRLCITAGTEESGKTVLMNHMVGNLVNKPQPVELMKPAPFFRIAEEYHPTFLIDECDVFIREDTELLAAINSGWEPHGGVPRCVGDDNEVRIFSTHTPTAMAGIQLHKKLPPTTIGRSIVIGLERAIDGEIETIYNKKIHQHGIRETGRKMARFIADNRVDILSCKPVLPDGVRNRLADKWTPLFAIAEIAGGEWPSKMEMALHGQINLSEPTRALLLLEDVKKVMPSDGHIYTATLIEKLCRLEGAQWTDYNFSAWDTEKKKISDRQVSNLLGQYGLKPKTVKIAGTTKKGYHREALENAFKRYIHAPLVPTPPIGVTPSLSLLNAGSSPSPSVTPKYPVTDSEPPKPLQDGVGDGVTGKPAVSPKEGMISYEF
jgi:hypothetical protein